MSFAHDESANGAATGASGTADEFKWDESGWDLDSTDDGHGWPDEEYDAPPQLPPGRPPMKLLAVSAALSVVGVAIAVVLRSTWFGLALGWITAGPAAIFVLGQYIQKDSVQRSRPVYLGKPATRHYPTILGILAIMCVVVVAVLAAGKAARAW